MLTTKRPLSVDEDEDDSESGLDMVLILVVVIVVLLSIIAIAVAILVYLKIRGIPLFNKIFILLIVLNERSRRKRNKTNGRKPESRRHRH